MGYLERAERWSSSGGSEGSTYYKRETTGHKMASIMIDIRGAGRWLGRATSGPGC